MIRYLLVAAVAALVLTTPVEAKRAILLYTPVQKLVRADAVVVGKVTALEKEAVTATPNPGATEKLSYKVAVIKVETGLVGAANVTHIKVGFFPPPPANPAVPVRPIRGGFQQVNLTEGMEGLFYLTKHHSGDFYTISPMLNPIDAKADDYKAQVAQATAGAAVLADPMKALKAEKAADRYSAATVLVQKYRAYPENGAAEQVKVSADESTLVLKALAEGNWTPDPNAPNGYQAFAQLGLTDKDGWKYPQVKPGEDVYAKTKEAFVAWLAGAGKDYQISKWAPKKK